MRALDPHVLHGLMFSSPAVTDAAPPDLTAGVPVVFTSGGRRAEVASPATKAALMVLMETWPRAIDVEALCRTALDRAAPFLAGTSIDEARGAMVEDLFGSVMYGLIELHTQAPLCTNRPSDAPRAHPVAAYQAESGDIVVNAHHEMIQLDALAIEVLKLSNGRRRRNDMLDTLVGWRESGRLVLEDDGGKIDNPVDARALLSDRLEKTLASLTRSAVLIE
jgi:methyltransferase-like protein